MRSKKDPRLQVIPDNSWTIESIRDATKEEIEKEYQKIKDGQDSKKFYIILPNKIKSFTISDSDQIRLATRSEIKRAYDNIRKTGKSSTRK